MARAKHTARSEARRRYRVANRPDDVELDGDGEDEEAALPARTTAAGAGRPAARQSPARDAAPASGRPSITGAFRGAYRPAHPREDLRHLPEILGHWSFAVAIAAVVLTAGAFVVFPGYSGSTLAWDNIVIPGNAVLTPLFVGFFARRASYILGFLIGLVQAIAYLVSISLAVASLGTAITSAQIPSLIGLSLFSGAMTGLAFASAAAWYRRFLAMSSVRRAAQRTAQTKAKTPARASSRR